MKGEKRIKTIKEIKKEVIEHYDENPKGWNVFQGRDSENYLSSLFWQDDKFWMIKEFIINPYKVIGCGIEGTIKKSGGRLKKLKPPVEFGLRPLVPEQIEALLEGDPTIIEDALNSPALPSEKCLSFPLVLSGPIFMSDKEMFISNAQERLDRKLRGNLRELIYRKYPGLCRSYR